MFMGIVFCLSFFGGVLVFVGFSSVGKLFFLCAWRGRECGFEGGKTSLFVCVKDEGDGEQEGEGGEGKVGIYLREVFKEDYHPGPAANTAQPGEEGGGGPAEIKEGGGGDGTEDD
jgi:hypothetical protein